MRAKEKFINSLHETLKKKPKVVLFWKGEVPFYKMLQIDEKIPMYELTHEITTQFLQLRADTQNFPRFVGLLRDRLYGNINKVEVLFKDGSINIYKDD